MGYILLTAYIKKRSNVVTMTSKRPLIIACCLIAFITAIIAPACKAMSGELSFIEICTSLGTIERVPNSGDSQESQNTNTPSAMKNACGFCLHDDLSKTVRGLYPREELIANLSDTAHTFHAPLLLTPSNTPEHKRARAPPIAIHS